MHGATAKAEACCPSVACFAGLCHLLGLLPLPADCHVALLPGLLEGPVLLESCFVTSLLQGESGDMPRLLALTRARVMYCIQNHAALDVAAVVSDELSLLAELAAASSSAAAGKSCCTPLWVVATRGRACKKVPRVNTLLRL